MRLFSQRKGIKPVKKIQRGYMDDDLRNSLWNAFISFYWSNVEGEIIFDEPWIYDLCKSLWLDYFKKPLDTLLSMSLKYTYQKIKDYFFNCHWYEVYDFIEFIVNSYPYEGINSEFMEYCNSVLERELSAYRFVGGKIVEITSEEEISEIEEALEISKPLKGVHTHLKRALELLADRKSPDYRNSIKESISAVEAICRLITGEGKATLGEALNKMKTEAKVDLHPALKSALDNLYGYTSDEKGIRHSLLDEPNLNFEDAKFMLVSCSAFINYLFIKASKAGILKNISGKDK